MSLNDLDRKVLLLTPRGSKRPETNPQQHPLPTSWREVSPVETWKSPLRSFDFSSASKQIASSFRKVNFQSQRLTLRGGAFQNKLDVKLWGASLSFHRIRTTSGTSNVSGAARDNEPAPLKVGAEDDAGGVYDCYLGSLPSKRTLILNTFTCDSDTLDYHLWLGYSRLLFMISN